MLKAYHYYLPVFALVGYCTRT